MMLPPSRYYPAYVNPDISTFPGNRILAPFNLIQWTSGGSASDASYIVAPQPPALYKYNSDVASQALIDHYSGASPLDDTTLGAGAGCCMDPQSAAGWPQPAPASTSTTKPLLPGSGGAGAAATPLPVPLPTRLPPGAPAPPRPPPLPVADSIVAAINGADNIDNTPAGSASAATWRGFDSSLYKIALDAAKAWDCGAGVAASTPLNRLAVRRRAAAQQHSAAEGG